MTAPFSGGDDVEVVEELEEPGARLVDRGDDDAAAARDLLQQRHALQTRRTVQSATDKKNHNFIDFQRGYVIRVRSQFSLVLKAAIFLAGEAKNDFSLAIERRRATQRQHLFFLLASIEGADVRNKNIISRLRNCSIDGDSSTVSVPIFPQL